MLEQKMKDLSQVKKRPLIALILARGGSKRLPKKNIMDLCGLPLIVYSIKYAQKHLGLVDDIYVSTDDDAIRAVALEYGAKVVERSAEDAGDFTTSGASIKHALENISSIANTEVDTICLQPTNPFRSAALLVDCYQLFVNAQSKGSAKAVFSVSRDYSKLIKIAEDGSIQPFNYYIGQRSQELEPLYFENGNMYITPHELIQEGKIFDEFSIAYEDKEAIDVDIDTMADFELACYFMGKENAKEKLS